MQTNTDMRGEGVKNRGKIADILYGRPLILDHLANSYFILQIYHAKSFVKAFPDCLIDTP